MLHEPARLPGATLRKPPPTAAAPLPGVPKGVPGVPGVSAPFLLLFAEPGGVGAAGAGAHAGV